MPCSAVRLVLHKHIALPVADHAHIRQFDFFRSSHPVPDPPIIFTRISQNCPRVPSPAPQGRGGSVSRRDHSPAARNRFSPLRRDQLCRSSQLKRQPLFGRRGLGRRGFSQRSRLLPRNPPKLPPSQLTMEINSALIVLGCTCRCSSLESCQGLRRRGRGKHQCARDRDAPPRPTPSAPAADGDPA